MLLVFLPFCQIKKVCPSIISTTSIPNPPPCTDFSIIELVVSGSVALGSSSIQAGGTDVVFSVEATLEGIRNATLPYVEVVFPPGLLLSYLPPGCHSANSVLRCAFASSQVGSNFMYVGALRARPTAPAG